MRKDDEDRKLFRRAKEHKISTGEVYSQMGHHGVFVIFFLSRKIAVDKILPTYYTRQQIEQTFDIGKNYADMLPLRVQKEDTFRGHLLLTFILCVILKMIQDKLLKTKYNPISMFINLRNQKCMVYDKLSCRLNRQKRWMTIIDYLKSNALLRFHNFMWIENRGRELKIIVS